MKREYIQPKTIALSFETSYGVLEGQGSIGSGGDTKGNNIHEAYSKQYHVSSNWDDEEEEE